MPYATNRDLPAAVRRRLPASGQSMWREVFNSAAKQYPRDERRQFAIAWGTVKRHGFDPPADLTGGLSEGMSPADFDAEQLEIGTKIELEHTKDRAVAQRIAMDHLKEFGNDYYKSLIEMERALSQRNTDPTEAVMAKSPNRSSAAAKLEAQAANLEADAQARLHHEGLENTPKRAREAESRRSGARRQLQVAETMRGIAARLRSGEPLEYVSRISTKAEVEELEKELRRAGWDRHRAEGRSVSVEQRDIEAGDADFASLKTASATTSALRDAIAAIPANKAKGSRQVLERARSRSTLPANDGWITLTPDEAEAIREAAKTMAKVPHSVDRVLESIRDDDRLRRLGIVDTPTLRAALREYMACCRGGPKQPSKEDKAKARRRALQFAKIPGFFPTPRGLAERAVRLAEIQPGDLVLEPSAGSGAIAEIIRGQHPAATLEVVEYNHTLRELLADEGFNLVGSDFMAFDGGPYDAIVMNPPFEDRGDTKQVAHALTMLKPGGRIVAIVSGSFGSRSDAATRELRAQLEEWGADLEPIPAGTFKEAGTDVSTMLISATKPGSRRKDLPTMAKQPGSLFAAEDEGFALVGQRGTVGRVTGPERGEQTLLTGVSMKRDPGKMAEIAAEQRATGPREAGMGPMFESGPPGHRPPTAAPAKVDEWAADTGEAVTVDGFIYKIARRSGPALAADEFLSAGDPQHVHQGPTPTLRSFAVYSDGSGANANVEFYGDVWVTRYEPDGTISARRVPRKGDEYRRRVAWKDEASAKKAKAAFEQRLLPYLTPEWKALHAAVHGLFAPDRGAARQKKAAEARESMEKQAMPPVRRYVRVALPISGNNASDFYDPVSSQFDLAGTIEFTTPRTSTSVFEGFDQKVLEQAASEFVRRARAAYPGIEATVTYEPATEALGPETEAEQAATLNEMLRARGFTTAPVSGPGVRLGTKSILRDGVEVYRGTASQITEWLASSESRDPFEQRARPTVDDVAAAALAAAHPGLSDRGKQALAEYMKITESATRGAGLTKYLDEKAQRARQIWQEEVGKAERARPAAYPELAARKTARAQLAAPEDMIVVHYSSAEGITLSGPTKTYKDKIARARHGSHGFRWSPKQKLWYVPRSRDTSLIDRPVVEAIAGALAEAGVPTRVEYEGEIGAAVPAGLVLDPNSPLLSLDLDEARALLAALASAEQADLRGYVRSLPVFAGQPEYSPPPAVPTYAHWDADRYVKESQWKERRQALGREAELALETIRANRAVSEETFVVGDEADGEPRRLTKEQMLGAHSLTVDGWSLRQLQDLVESHPKNFGLRWEADDERDDVASVYSKDDTSRYPLRVGAKEIGGDIGVVFDRAPYERTATPVWSGVVELVIAATKVGHVTLARMTGATAARPPADESALASDVELKPKRLTPTQQRAAKAETRRERDRLKREAEKAAREEKAAKARATREANKLAREQAEEERKAKRAAKRAEAAGPQKPSDRSIKMAECALRKAAGDVHVLKHAWQKAEALVQELSARAPGCGRNAETAAKKLERARVALTRASARLEHAKGVELLRESKLLELRRAAGLGELAAAPTMVLGSSTVVVVPSPRGTPKTYPARFALVDAEAVVPSHDATTFEPRADYPAGVQERRYERDQAEQLKVQDVGRNMIPELIQNTNAGAVDGTPIIDGAWVALSGNGRSMGVQRSYRTGQTKLREWLKDNAAQFGLQRADVQKLERPLVVRVISVEPTERARLVRDFNEGLTQRLDVYDELAAKARQLPETTPAILRDGNADAMGVKSYLASQGASPLIFALEQSGFINRVNRSRLLSSADRLSPEAQQDIAGLLSSAVLPGTVAPALRALVDRSAVAWLVAAAAGGEWDVRPALRLAVTELGSMKSAEQCLARWRQQADIEGARATNGNPIARMLLELLIVTANKPRVFESIGKAFAQKSRSAGGGLFGGGQTPLEALRSAATENGVEPSDSEAKRRCRK